jgi:hypothetical protein
MKCKIHACIEEIETRVEIGARKGGDGDRDRDRKGLELGVGMEAYCTAFFSLLI